MSAPTSKRSAGSTFGRILLGLLVTVLVLLLLAEFGLRWFIGKQLRESFVAQETAATSPATSPSNGEKTEPSISFGTEPLVFSLLRGTISQVEIDTPSTLQIIRPGEGSASNTDTDAPVILGQPATQLKITNLNVSDQDNLIAGHLVATSHIPDDFLLATVEQSMAENAADASPLGAFIQGLITITDISSNPEKDAVDVEFSGGAAVLNLRPVPVDGQLTFEAVGASLFGIDLPDQLTSGITRALEEGLQEQTRTLDIDEVAVNDGGISLTVSGEQINLNQLESTAPVL